MNVTVENLGPCKKLLRVELEAPAVEAVFQTVIKEFNRHATFPGFRPGKAPSEAVFKRFEKEIAEEAKRKLLGEHYRKAVDEQKLRVVKLVDLEEVQFSRGQALQFVATVETAPEFELPEYRGLPARRETTTVTDQEVERALDVLRGQYAEFPTVDRPLQAGDIAVINYTGTCDGQPIGELAPAHKSLSGKTGFWVALERDQFLPGFAEQLTGAKAGDRRTVKVDFPTGFMARELAGKTGAFEVEVVEAKQKVLPPWDENLVKRFKAESVEALRGSIRVRLQNDLLEQKRQSIRNQVVKALLGRVNFELPESTVQAETRNLVFDIVNRNKERGIASEVIDQQKDQIYQAANLTARERVKAQFVFQRIATKEGLEPTEQEVSLRIMTLANQYQTPVKKFVKELEERGALGEIVSQLVSEKVIEFLAEYAKIEDVPPGSGV